MRMQDVVVLGTLLASTVTAIALPACSSGTNQAGGGEGGRDAAACPNPNALDASPDQVELPRPTGLYGIGTQRRTVVDTSRTDPQAPDAGMPRTLMVQLYYPTDPCTSGNRAPYMMPAEAFVLTLAGGEGFEFPPGWQDRDVVHGRESIPPSSDGAKFPVVLFSHGMGAQGPNYTSLVEDLASHGFVVVAVSHTYDSDVVVFPDGTVVEPNWSWRPPAGTAAGEEALDAHIAVWVADARLVLDQLTAWNRSDPQGLLAGRLDLDHVGYFGHSYGGATAAEICALDPRFKAGINLDGAFFSPTRTDGGRSIPTPFMIQLNQLRATNPNNPDPDSGLAISSDTS